MKQMCSACGKRPKLKKNRLLCFNCYSAGYVPGYEDIISREEAWDLFRKAEEIVREHRKNPPNAIKHYSASNMTQEELSKLIPAPGYPCFRGKNLDLSDSYYGGYDENEQVLRGISL